MNNSEENINNKVIGGLTNANNKNPLISVILPVKKGHKTIVRAVQSVINQTYRPIEIIVVDEHAGYKSATKQENINSEAEEKKLSIELRELLNKHFGQYDFFRIIDGPAKGPGVARDIALKASNGLYAAFLDDDDIWSENDKLALQVAFLEAREHAQIEAVGTEFTHFIDESGQPIKTITQPTSPDQVRRQMLLRNPLITSSVLIRKEAYLKSGGFKPMYLAEEYDLWLRLGRSRNVIANVPNTSISYTYRANSLSHRRKTGMAKNVLILVIENIKYYPNRIFAIIKALLRLFISLF